MFTTATFVALAIAVIGAVAGAILFELIRERTMKVIREITKATGRALTINVSKPVVLIPLVIASVFIAALLLRAVGPHSIV